MKHGHKCLDCERTFITNCDSEECITDDDSAFVYDHCGCVEEREYQHQLAMERWARRLEETGIDPTEDYDEGPEKKEF